MDYILDDLQAQVIVPGHGEVYDRKRACNQRDYFRALVEQFDAAYEPGRSLEELMAMIHVEEFIDHRPATGYQMCIRGMYKERSGK